MKKIVVLACIAFLVSGPFRPDYTTASPMTTIFMDPPLIRERPSGRFTVDINVSEVENLAGFIFALGWNASVLNFTGVEYGGFLGGSRGQPPENIVLWEPNTTYANDGKLLIECLLTPIGGFTPANGSGTLVSLTFEVEAWGETLIEFEELLPDEGERIILLRISADGTPEFIPHEPPVDGVFTNLEGPPVASFTYSPATPKIGQTVLFDASASYDFGGSIVDYIWGFGDDTTIVLNDPIATHTFLTAKTYHVTLNVTDDTGESNAYATELTASAPRTIYVNASNVGDPEEDGSPEHPFDMIQEGVNTAGWGDTVRVASGTYLEHVTINVSRLTLVGEKGSETLIDGSETGNAVTVMASDVSMHDFTIQNGAPAGIYQSDSTGVTIRDNTILDSGVGIDLHRSSSNVIVGNDVTSNADTGISLDSSHDNTVIGNIVSGSEAGIVLFNSSNNCFSGNTVEQNNVGVSLDMESELNKFHHNNFTDSVNRAVDEASNIWDDGYPSGGNYWSDYKGQDPDGDSIGDIPYSIDFDSQDRYPLTPFWKDTIIPIADAGEDRTVDEDTFVLFDGSASWDNVGIVNYTWSFTDVTTQILTGTKPTYVFETPGIYPVVLTVEDVADNWATDNITITVLDITKPVANAGQDQTVAAGTTVTFNANGSSDNVGIVSYEWDFGDDTPLVTENDPVTTHTYTEPGNFTVTLTVRDEAENFDTTYVVIKVRKAAAEQLIPLWVIGIATAVIGGVVAGTALVLLKQRGKRRARARGSC